jgi:hypothetical protein
LLMYGSEGASPRSRKTAGAAGTAAKTSTSRSGTNSMRSVSTNSFYSVAYHPDLRGDFDFL